jgi:hypothetical protein
MLANLQTLAAVLDQITEGAGRAHEATLRLTTSAGGASTSLTSLSSLLSSVSEEAAQTARTVETTLADLVVKPLSWAAEVGKTEPGFAFCAQKSPPGLGLARVGGGGFLVETGAEKQ